MVAVLTNNLRLRSILSLGLKLLFLVDCSKISHEHIKSLGIQVEPNMTQTFGDS